MEQPEPAAVGLALVAGELVWADVDEAPSGLERLTAMVELAALTAIVSILWVMSSARSPSPSGVGVAVPLTGTVAALMLASRPVRMLTGRHRAAGLWPSVAWRVVTAITLMTCLVVNAPAWGAASVWPLGIAFGAEAALCAWRLGLPVEPARWFRSFLMSPVHVGAAAAMAAAVIRLGWPDGLDVAATYYVLLHVLVAVSCLTAGTLDRVNEQQRVADEAAAERLSATEHRRRAHWLHDDVSSQIRIASLRVQNDGVTPSDVVGVLDELDHNLRLRQLDELLDSGTARLAEIIQPHVRNAQAHGVEITTVPTFDDASLLVGTITGRLVARATSIFTSNAINAGTTEIGYELEHDADSVTVRVSDNAGGFELGSAPAGRALWDLTHQLGRGSVTSTPTARGTTMTAIVRIEETDRGEDPAR